MDALVVEHWAWEHEPPRVQQRGPLMELQGLLEKWMLHWSDQNYLLAVLGGWEYGCVEQRQAEVW